MSGYVFAETDKLEQIGDALRTTSGSTQTYSVSQLSETAAAAISSGNVVTYPLPIANSTELGGVMPVAKTDEMTEPVGVDSEGKLYTSIPTISLNNITGTLSIAKGGTGATDAEGARAALGITPTNIGAAPSSHSHASSDITSGTLTITQGGTGATDAATARTNLEITPANIGAAASSHNQSAATITSGTLALARGGTGASLSAAPSMLTNLGSTTAASIFAASPRPGVTGTLPIANGGTGKTTAADARAALGANSATNLTTGTLPAARLPFKYQFGTASITQNWSTISLSAGFTSAPMVLVSFTDDAASSSIQPIKTMSRTKTSFQVCMCGSNTTARTICWFAIGT